MKKRKLLKRKLYLLIVVLILPIFSLLFLNHVLASSEYIMKFQKNLPKGIPADLWEMLIPEDNPMTEAKVSHLSLMIQR